MPLSKRQGNMYDWVTHTWSVLQGQCPHECSYCYVANGHWTKGSPAYQGPPRLEPNFDKVKLGRDRIIFVAHTSDLFAEGVPSELISKVFLKMMEYRGNRYVVQTKNPGRLLELLTILPRPLPRLIIGTTIETDDQELLYTISKAPPVKKRSEDLWEIKKMGWAAQTFITMEPVLRFKDPYNLAVLIDEADPDWVNIGADSKGCRLPEPPMAEVEELMVMLRNVDIEIREKSNLDRLRKVA